MTPNDLFNSFDKPGGIGSVTYHVTVLAKMGVLSVVRHQQVRGAQETNYYFSSRAWSRA